MAANSKFVNAFANYLKLGEFDTAKESTVFKISPSKLPFLNQNDAQSDNHGQPLPCCFSIDYAGRLVRFIDPIGQDLTDLYVHDFSKTLDYLGSQCVPIDGICVLIKSRDTLKTPSFESLLTQIFVRLPKDAYRNVIICFNFDPNFFCSIDEGPTALLKILQKEFDVVKQDLTCFFINYEALHLLRDRKQEHAFDQKREVFHREIYQDCRKQSMSMISKIFNINEICFVPALSFINELPPEEPMDCDELECDQNFHVESDLSIKELLVTDLDSDDKPIKADIQMIPPQAEPNANKGKLSIIKSFFSPFGKTPTTSDNLKPSSFKSTTSHTMANFEPKPSKRDEESVNQSIAVANKSSESNVTEPSQPEFNILLLGETGAGKSTTINAFANYLKYSSFDDAMSNDFVQLISSKFMLPDPETGEPIVIQSGEDKNEQHGDGNSSTQDPMGYTFRFGGGTTLRIIDTPGMGDTAGAEVDRMNFDKILSYLDMHKNLHGICILMKATETRKTASFRYCINQLLTHLNKSACKNIVFCFTFSRNSHYGPGEGFTTLKGFLEKELSDVDLKLKSGVNCFYVDNEAYRFLVAKKSGYRFHLRQANSYRESWETSAEQTHQMIQCILNLEPHSLVETSLLKIA